MRFVLLSVLFVLAGCSAVSVSSDASETATATSSPFLNATFFVDPDSNAAVQIEEWQEARPDDAELLQRIASQPTANWFGDWNDDIGLDVGEKVDEITGAGALPVLVVYNIPNRDCGGYSSGGSVDAQAYQEWITAFADAIGSRTAVLVLEPDALGLISCLEDEDAALRYDLLSFAVSAFKSFPHISVYIDAGHSNWIETEEMAERLTLAGIEEADGFALNVSNFYTDDENTGYGEEISVLVGDKHFIIDSSRNGAGSNGEWCNPDGRALGRNPTAETGHELIDALFWIKPPGESDGECNAGPSAGTWWSDYALALAQAAEELDN